MRNLGQYFEHLAYEYSLPRAIKEGYLSPIKAVTIPLKLDLTGVGIQAGDFKTATLTPRSTPISTRSPGKCVPIAPSARPWCSSPGADF